jgi:hypothetical protein
MSEALFGAKGVGDLESQRDDDLGFRNGDKRNDPTNVEYG